MRIHIISDLFLGFTEFSTNEEILPDCDLVIINGNIGKLKRAMLYVETLCNKYPDIPFVVNLGLTEQSQPEKYPGEVEESLRIRRDSNNSWPKNLIYTKEPTTIRLKNGDVANLLCAYGYPKILKCNIDWKETDWYKYHSTRIVEGSQTEFKPDETSNVRHGVLPIPMSIEDINKQHDLEWKKIKTWEITPGEGKRILVTHVNPYKDSRYTGLSVSPYLIHLMYGTWICADTHIYGLNFLGGKLYSNPGRGSIARSKVVVI